MLFAAFAMILVGVLCFLYVSLAPGSNKPEARGESRQSGTFRYTPSSTAPSQYEERILRERQIHSRNYDPTPFEEEKITPPAVVEKTEVLTETKSGKLEPEPEIPEINFEIFGTLYMDHSGKIAFGKTDLQNDTITEESFRNFKRVGKGKLQESGGKFIFLSGNVSYTYLADELEQVVLHNQGIVFLLKDGKVPRPVFFTEEIDQFKEFLKQASVKV